MKKKLPSQPIRKPLQLHEIMPQIDSLESVQFVISKLISISMKQLLENEIQLKYAISCVNACAEQISNMDGRPTQDMEDQEPKLPKSDARKNYSIQILKKSPEFDVTDNQSRRSRSSIHRSKQKINNPHQETQEFKSIRPISLNQISIYKQVEDLDEPYRQIHLKKIQKIQRDKELIKKIEDEEIQKSKQITHIKRMTSMKGYTYDYNGGFILLKEKQPNLVPSIYQVEFNFSSQKSKSTLVQTVDQEYVKKTARVLQKQSAFILEEEKSQDKQDKEDESQRVSRSKFKNHNLRKMTEQQKSQLLLHQDTRLTKDEYYQLKEMQEKQRIRKQATSQSNEINDNKSEFSIQVQPQNQQPHKANSALLMHAQSMRQPSQGSIQNYKPHINMHEYEQEQIIINKNQNQNQNHIINKLNRTRSGMQQKFSAFISFEEGGLPPIKIKLDPIKNKALNNSIKLPRQRNKMDVSLINKQKRSISYDK